MVIYLPGEQHEPEQAVEPSFAISIPDSGPRLDLGLRHRKVSAAGA